MLVGSLSVRVLVNNVAQCGRDTTPDTGTWTSSGDDGTTPASVASCSASIDIGGECVMVREHTGTECDSEDTADLDVDGGDGEEAG